jgi:hypothetical protein
MEYTEPMLKTAYRRVFTQEPAIRVAYERLTPADQKVIDCQVLRLANRVRRLGLSGAMETLFKLGRFIKVKENHYVSE